MDSVSVAEAEGRLGELLDRVQAGEEIDIVRDGEIVARLSAAALPKVAVPRKPIDIAALRAFNQSMPMQDVSAGDFVRAMRDSDRY